MQTILGKIYILLRDAKINTFLP